MYFIKGLQLFVLITFLSASLYAEKPPTATITLSNSYETIGLIKEAHKIILRVDESIAKLMYLAMNVIAMEEFPPEIEAKFQAKKYKIATELHQLQLNLNVFRSDITITTYDDDTKSYLKFGLPNLTEEAANLYRTRIRTKQEAVEAIDVLKNLLNRVNVSLPSDLNDDSLKNFLVLKPTLVNSDLTQISFTHREDTVSLINALVDLKWRVTEHLNAVIRLAKIAAKGEQTQETLEALDLEYQSKVSDFFWPLIMEGYKLNTNISVYHDIKLVLPLPKGMHKDYFFPQIDLVTLQLEADNISSFTSTLSSLEHLRVAFSWSSLWIITNDAVLSDVVDSVYDFSKILSSLNLNTSQKALILKRIKSSK
ncbi:hypothetical protein TUM19329_07830 [Legionella antarctica]|uniref:Uncharacterized protein n=1 Tax=Legionella antarctica TaxID=2708020 RepID=A0A6F8T325_9GAMM|nr:hypothetical protein [Legionella antarctica]BCA94422.1 hypothetical protein TUM19329_07830 [Legionella antarctica]